MIFRQLFDQESCTYTYLIADPNTLDAIIIDSVSEQFERDLQLIKELNLNLLYSLETHVHADHITAANRLKSATGCKIGYCEASQVQCADMLLKDQETLSVGEIMLVALQTPGHTNCSTCYLVNNTLLFTGDTLFVRGCGRTDFQEGSAATLYDNVTQRLFSLPDDTLVYPGHDYKGMSCSSIGEEKTHNPRFAGISKNEFIDIMNNLNLPNPKRFDEAVPANKQCGMISP